MTYLAFSDGGYDTVPRGQVGVVAWWIVLLAAAVGVLRLDLGRAGWAAFALLAAFAVWSGISIAWSESAALSADELGRVATYAGVLLLALVAVRWSGRAPVLNGAAAAVGLVGLLAVLSRLHPGWFPVDQQLVFFGGDRRLSYPINYWNGLAAFLAMGVPLLLGRATGARTAAGRALAAAGVPVLALGMFFTVSRGGVIAVAVALVAYLLLTSDRLLTLATVAVCAGGAALLIGYADARPLLQDGLRTGASLSAGDAMLPILAPACAAVALAQTGICFAAGRLLRPRWLRPTQVESRLALGGVVAVALLVAVAAGAPGRLEHAWRDFKAPPSTASAAPASGDLFARLGSAAGNDRYQYWKVAAHEASQRPLEGSGAGTFVLVWARHANTRLPVQDAHSLYLQALGETGYPGLLLVVGFVLTVLIAGAVRALRSPPRTRVLIASATAGAAAFYTAAVYDWVWQLGALTVLMLLLGAVALAPAATEDGGPTPRPGRGRRVLAVLGAGAALVAVWLPVAEAQDLQRSQAAFSRGEYATALADARSAERVQPYAASARLQEAIVLEQLGRYSGARAAAAAATRDEPTNWQTWVILARIEAELGHGPAALADFARARTLDPEGALF